MCYLIKVELVNTLLQKKFFKKNVLTAAKRDRFTDIERDMVIQTFRFDIIKGIKKASIDRHLMQDKRLEIYVAKRWPGLGRKEHVQKLCIYLNNIRKVPKYMKLAETFSRVLPNCWMSLFTHPTYLQLWAPFQFFIWTICVNSQYTFFQTETHSIMTNLQKKILFAWATLWLYLIMRRCFFCNTHAVAIAPSAGWGPLIEGRIGLPYPMRVVRGD